MSATNREKAEAILAAPLSPAAGERAVAYALLHIGDQLAAVVEQGRATTVAEPRRPLPAVVVDRDGDLWDRVVESVDSYAMRHDPNEVRILDGLRDAFGPLYPAGTAL